MKDQKENIVLIGMPGSGKSTVGVILAKVLGYTFVDSDLLIQKEEKKLLKDIIAKEGQEGFLKIENRVNKSIDTEKSVIATGGSVVYCQEAMEHLKKIGTVLYLKLDYQILNRRLSNLIGRGVVAVIAAGQKSYLGVCLASPAAWILASVLLIAMYYYIVKVDLKKIFPGKTAGNDV